MRKLAVAGALAFAALSWAHGARADDAAKESREAARSTGSEVKEEAREAREGAKRGAERTGQEAREQAQRAERAVEGKQQRAAGEERKHPLFSGKSNYDVEGKVQKVSADSITVQREELPAATLEISKNTVIELDGERVSASQLKPGQDVKASFNLRGDTPEAVEIRAEKPQQQGGQRQQESSQGQQRPGR